MKKYHQTKRAYQLLDEPWLYLDIGDFGEGPQVEYIVDGTYVCTDNTDPAVKKIVRHIQLPPTVWSNKHTTLMILAKYMSWKGPHIGIYKATGQYPLQGWIFHKRSEISYLSSYYSICQHLTGNDIRLLEKYDLWDVQDLWNIFLLWSEVIHTYNLIGGEAMGAAIDNKKNSMEQYSTPQRSDVDHGINRRLVFDY